MSLLSCRRDFPVTEIFRQGSPITKIMIGDHSLEIEDKMPREHRNCLFVISVTKEDFHDWEGRCFVAGSPVILYWHKLDLKGYICFDVPPVFPGP